MDRRKQVGSTTKVLDHQPEHDFLGRCTFRPFAGDLGIVVRTTGDRLGENGRVRRQAGDREVAYVRLEQAGVDHVPGDVIQPQTLAEVLKLRGRIHELSCVGLIAVKRYRRPWAPYWKNRRPVRPGTGYGCAGFAICDNNALSRLAATPTLRPARLATE